MQRNHRSRSFAPALNPLEGRALLSGLTSHAASFTKMSSAVSLMDEGVYVKHNHLKSVNLTAKVTSKSGMPTATGTVTFEMVMPSGMKMHGMKPGTTVLGTETLGDGKATLTGVMPKLVLKMPITVVHSGDANYAGSTDSPTPETKAELMSMTMSMGGMTMSSKGMGGMKM